MRRILVLVLAAGACASPTSAPPLRHLDRPTDVAFACVALTGGGNPQAVPTATCAAGISTADAGPIDAGGFSGFSQVGFVIEQVRGDVSVINVGLGSFVDSDRFAPGLNGIPVGRLPSSITTTSTGCHVAVANSASCDLSIVSVVNAFLSRPDSVRFTNITSTAGRVLAQPTMIVAPPSLPAETPPPDCATAPETAFVSFPGCNLVARVDLGSGAILDGVRYRSGQPPEIVGPDVTCPAECNAAAPALAPQVGGLDAGVADAGPGADGGSAVQAHPTAVAVEDDGSRLYIGSYDSPSLLVVTLDAAGKPTALSQLPLEGIQGITKIVTSGDIQMGQPTADGPTFRFAYVIGVDQAIHVVDITPGRAPRECDTQIDRRYLHDKNDIELFSCFPIGGPKTPPRRADAVGPGIRLPEGVAPMDVAFLHPTFELTAGDRPQPTIMNGVMAVVTAIGPIIEARLGRGLAYIINVDDDNYEDFESTSGIGAPDISYALPHMLRDGNLQRRISRTGCAESQITRGDIGPARLLDNPIRQTGFIYADFGLPGDPFAPGLHRVACDSQIATWELQMVAPQSIRGELFADLERLSPRAPAGGSTSDEVFNVAWEGPLAFETANSRRNGGRVTIEDQDSMTVRAAGGQLCSIGTEVGDIVSFLGCSTDADCPLDETCTVHPEAPSGVAGMCLKTSRVNELTSLCKRLMVTQRLYTAIEVGDEHATVVPRPSVFDGSPIGGCTSTAQCVAVEEEILADTEVRNGSAPGTLQRHNFTCEVDAFRGGAARCIITSLKKEGVPAVCTSDAHCDASTVCEGGRCVLGPIPPQVCFDSLQRFEPRAGDSFVVTSSQQSFPRRTISDPKTGLCIEDPHASPLLGNRIRRVEPDCGDTSVTEIVPNPCHLVGTQEPFRLEDGTGIGLRDAYAMRLRGPGFSFDLTDVATPLRSMPNVLVSTIHSGFSFRFTMGGGFFPHSVELSAPFPERIRPSIDGSLWIVDSGDTSVGTRGQLLNMTTNGVVTDLRLR